MCVMTLVSAQSAAHPEAPVFDVEPDPEYFVAKGRPATLRCRASPAIQISVKCGSEWISPTQQVNEDVVDPTTGRTYLQTTVDITKEQVHSQSVSVRITGAPVPLSSTAGPLDSGNNLD